MKIIYGINNIKRLKNPVVAMGVFDGVHRGHQVILRAAARMARKIKGTSVVITFWPHPQEEESLCSLEHRLRLIAGLGIDACVVVNFNEHFARMRAEDFIRNILVKKLGARHVYIGKNFRFGKGAEAGLKQLEDLSVKHGFKARGFDIIKFRGRPVSSTLIRRLIKNGDLDGANKLFGRRVSVLGTVIKGISLAKRIGYPTANIDPHHEVVPPPGIYAALINLDKKTLKGVCYIGRKPTIEPKKKKIHIEVHIFNFKKNVYNKYLDVQFVKKIRSDMQFTSIACLAARIKKDILRAKKILSHN